MPSPLAIDKFKAVPIVRQDGAQHALGLSLSQQTAQMQVGCDDAWRWFHQRYYFFLLRYATARSSGPDDAAEIVQLTYLRIARHIRSFENETDFQAWIACLLRCTAVDYSRAITRRAALLEKFAHWRELRNQKETSGSFEPLSARANEALAELLESDARLLRRKYYEGWSTQELAVDAGTTPKAIENRLARLRHKLREIILNFE